jgi:hypothetical protein
MMAIRKHLASCRIRAAEWLRWEPAELVNDGGRLKMILLEYDVEVPIDKIYAWDVEILPLPYEEVGEEKD